MEGGVCCDGFVGAATFTTSLFLFMFLFYLGMPNTNGVVASIGRISTEDAPIVQRIKEAGAIPVGVSMIPELSMWWERSSHVYGRTNNAYDQRRIAGGSSGE